MKSKFYLIMIFCGFGMNATTDAAVKTGPVHADVRYDRAFYQLNYDSKIMSYIEGGRTYKIKVAPCSQGKIEKVIREYHSLLAKSKNDRRKKPSPFDVIVNTRQPASEFKVARGSPFGTWLRDLPKKIMYVDAEARVSCKK